MFTRNRARASQRKKVRKIGRIKETFRFCFSGEREHTIRFSDVLRGEKFFARPLVVKFKEGGKCCTLPVMLKGNCCFSEWDSGAR